MTQALKTLEESPSVICILPMTQGFEVKVFPPHRKVKERMELLREYLIANFPEEYPYIKLIHPQKKDIRLLQVRYHNGGYNIINKNKMTAAINEWWYRFEPQLNEPALWDELIEERLTDYSLRQWVGSVIAWRRADTTTGYHWTDTEGNDHHTGPTCWLEFSEKYKEPYVPSFEFVFSSLSQNNIPVNPDSLRRAYKASPEDISWFSKVDKNHKILRTVNRELKNHINDHLQRIGFK